MPKLPEIPIEIWSEILQSATSVPDSVLYPQRVVVTMGCGLPGPSVQRYKASLAVKRTVVNVCRQWNALATSLLYEHVHIASTSQLTSLLDVVARQPVIRNPKDNRTLGSLVKRADLMIPNLLWSVEIQRGQFGVYGAETDALKLCKSLPNLITLIFDGDVDALDLWSLSETIPPRLEYFAPIVRFEAPISTLVEFLESHPNLVYLDPPLIDTYPESFSEDLKEVVDDLVSRNIFPSLQELVIPVVSDSLLWMTKLQASAFPKLTKLVIFHMDSEDRPEVSEFLTHFGRNITSLHLKVEHLPSLETICAGIRTFQEHLPILRELLISIRGINDPEVLDDEENLDFTFPGVKTLGLQFFGGGEWWFPRSSSTKFVSWAKTVLPDLDTIRLLGEENILLFQTLNLRPTFESFLASCRDLKLHVVDNFGADVNMSF